MYFSISYMRKGNPREGDDKVAQLVSLCQSWAGNIIYLSMSKLPLQEQSCIIVVYLLWEQGTFSNTVLFSIHTSLQIGIVFFTLEKEKASLSLNII